MKTKDLNFRSTVESGTLLTPHALYEMLAVDAVLLAMNEELPEMSDEENERLVAAAATAAQTVLALAHVATDWISLVEALHDDRAAEIRGELLDIIYEHLPRTPKHIRQDQDDALVAIRALCDPGDYDKLHSAMFDLELAVGLEGNYLIEKAFQLGFEISRDPSRLIFRAMDPVAAPAVILTKPDASVAAPAAAKMPPVRGHSYFAGKEPNYAMIGI